MDSEDGVFLKYEYKWIIFFQRTCLIVLYFTVPNYLANPKMDFFAAR